ncbi:hypothetical protein R3P38DRAFT_2776973 [Favolaschia claudopus]|uniref:Uncharacterized protein n=1 Tax=Favolaschia claudopus TaxID=2862362 RepID=A0AAW0BQV3_9AGAR
MSFTAHFHSFFLFATRLPHLPGVRDRSGTRSASTIQDWIATCVASKTEERGTANEVNVRQASFAVQAPPPSSFSPLDRYDATDQPNHRNDDLRVSFVEDGKTAKSTLDRLFGSDLEHERYSKSGKTIAAGSSTSFPEQERANVLFFDVLHLPPSDSDPHSLERHSPWCRVTTLHPALHPHAHSFSVHVEDDVRASGRPEALRNPQAIPSGKHALNGVRTRTDHARKTARVRRIAERRTDEKEKWYESLHRVDRTIVGVIGIRVRRCIREAKRHPNPLKHPHNVAPDRLEEEKPKGWGA